MTDVCIARWIKNLGRPYDTLVAEGIIPNLPLQELYKGRDWLDIEPADGLELSFEAKAKRLETIHIVLLSTMEGITEYKGELPRPFAQLMKQSEVRAHFGEPMESKGPTKLPMNTAIGGWDAYQLNRSIHPNAKVIFTYAGSLQVKTLSFTLIDKGHD